MKHKSTLSVILATTILLGTAAYTSPRLTNAGQINLNNPGNEPRSLSDIINFTQKANLAESQLTTSPTSPNPDWEQALRTINLYPGTSQAYKEGCTVYACPGGAPVPKDVEVANPTVAGGAGTKGIGVDACYPSSSLCSSSIIFVVNGNANTVSVIAGSTNNVLATVHVGLTPSGVAVNNVTNLAYVTNFGSNTTSVIDATSYTVLKNVTVGLGPVGVAVNPKTNLIYVTNNRSNSTSVIDGTTNTVLTTIKSGFKAPNGVDVDPTTNSTYVTNSGGNYVSVINGNTNTVVKNVTVGAGPSGVAVDPPLKRAYVARSPSFGTGLVAVIDTTSNTFLTNIPVGPSPFAIGVNPFSGRIYVANWLLTGITPCCLSYVTVIDGTSNTVILSASTEYFGLNQFSCLAGGLPCLGNPLGVDPSANLVYTLAASGISVIGQRPEIRDVCLMNTANCIVVSSKGTLFPGTPQASTVSLVAVSIRSNETKTGTQMALTVACEYSTADVNQRCSAFYVDGNIWQPGQTDLTKSPFIVQNAEPYFYIQFHWWDFTNSKIVSWGTWWYGTAANPNWYWAIYWNWRTYVNYYIGIWLPWWWWQWHWMYWRYWGFWTANFPT